MTGFDKIIEWFKQYSVKIALCFLVIIVLLLVVLLFKLFFVKIKKKLDTRGKKIASLIYSIIKYIIILFSIFIILSIWDFDTTIGVIVFSVIVLVIGLSAIPLIRDMLMGISIVFSNSYAEGDVIEVNGYKGKVVSFTIFKTKLQLKNGCVVIIENNTIHNVVNYSKDYINATVSIEITDLNKIDEIIKYIEETVDSIKDNVDGIVEGPNFVGLETIKDGIAIYKITAKTTIDDYNKVMKGLEEYVLKITKECINK